MSNERHFKGIWIPKELWLDERLNALDKIIFAEIDSLSNEERGCWASNKYLAEFCQCSETKISRAISKLIKLGYILVKSFDGRTRELQSRPPNFARQPCQKDKADTQKRQANNKENNKNIYNKGETARQGSSILQNGELGGQQVDKNPPPNIFEQIVGYLNQKAGTNHEPLAPDTIGFIDARLEENYTLEDFKKVIDNKVADWKGTDWEKYLRPSTLFGGKFEQYLSQRPKTIKQAEGWERQYTNDELNNLFDSPDDIDL